MLLYPKTGVYHEESATPILSISHGNFTDLSLFRLLFPRNRSTCGSGLRERASVGIFFPF